MHLCLFTSSVPFFMFPSRFVRSCSGILDVVIINIEEEGGIYDGIGNCNCNGEDLDDENDDCNDAHLNEKLFYEIFGHGVDVARPVYLPASKKKVSIVIVRFACFLILFLVSHLLKDKCTKCNQ